MSMIVARRTYTYLPEDGYEPGGAGWYSDQHAGIDSGVNLLPTMDENGDHASGFLFHDTIEHTGDTGEGDSGTELRAIGASLLLRSDVFADSAQAASVVSVLDEQGVPQHRPAPMPVTDGWTLMVDNTQASADHPCRSAIRDAIADAVADAWPMSEEYGEDESYLDEGDAGILAECISLRADGYTRDEAEESIQRDALAWIDSAAGSLSKLYPEAPYFPIAGVDSVEGVWSSFQTEVSDLFGDFSILSTDGQSVTFVIRADGSATVECDAWEEMRAEMEMEMDEE